MDVEQGLPAEELLANNTVHSVSWRDVTVTVRERKTRQPKVLLHRVEGSVQAGSGKTTLLKVLARRPNHAVSVQGSVLVNGRALSQTNFRHISAFVEQHEVLTGGLSVAESLLTNLRLAKSTPKKEAMRRIDTLLQSFGLVEQKNAVIATPIHQGISDGQKRRVMIARQLVASPKVLFLDEPTTGLDSAASFEVPSAATFNLFQKLLVLSAGKPHYFGAVEEVAAYYQKLGVDIPIAMNIPEFVLGLINTDFAQDRAVANRRLDELQSSWANSAAAKELHKAVLRAECATEPLVIEASHRPSLYQRAWILIVRNLIKSYRDPMAYGIRLLFSISFALLTGTVWLHLDHSQESIQALLSELCFIPCFISLSAIIYAPAFIEDHDQFVLDFRNGLYGPTEFLVANFVVSIPYTLLLSFLFAIVCYWLSNLSSTSVAFWTWYLWIFLTSFAAEALIVFVVSVFPNFMFSIALASFLNSLWLCTQGFLIPYTELNSFYKYAFHYCNYLAYSFQGLMHSQLVGAVYDCGQGCHCIYGSAVADQCHISGEAILDLYGYKEGGRFGRDIGIVIAITVGYRLISWVILRVKH
ncbi:ABC transporter G family member 15 [Beauveria bassiana D1-5]|uniref:ABC transporter G family member 15 n=1 Tax=Beauveria bassiana D1-5 TaxID=1245745 RepID=A0A0A2VF68_BEABA|nr:ABC transporter G family member 15 [Beauveria bassiana D1-5]